MSAAVVAYRSPLDIMDALAKIDQLNSLCTSTEHENAGAAWGASAAAEGLSSTGAAPVDEQASGAGAVGMECSSDGQATGIQWSRGSDGHPTFSFGLKSARAVGTEASPLPDAAPVQPDSIARQRVYAGAPPASAPTSAASLEPMRPCGERPPTPFPVSVEGRRKSRPTIRQIPRAMPETCRTLGRT